MHMDMIHLLTSHDHFLFVRRQILDYMFVEPCFLALHGQVIYRDFKSSNVLLDEQFRAKLSDFGLAREGPTGDRTHVSTSVSGGVIDSLYSQN